MVLSVDQFKDKLIGGGARANLFEVELQLPANVSFEAGGNIQTISEASKFLVKTAEIPGSTITPIIIPFRGRQVKISGDKTFDPWTVTVLNDTNFTIRSTIEKWMGYMNNHVDGQGQSQPAFYEAQLLVHQISRESNLPTHSWLFVGAWPSDLGPISVGFDNENQIEEYQITFQYQYWKSEYTDKVENTARIGQ